MKKRLLILATLLGLFGLASLKLAAQTQPTMGKITLGTELQVGDRMNLIINSIDNEKYPIKFNGVKPVKLEKGEIVYEITQLPVSIEGPFKTVNCTMSRIKTIKFENCVYLTELYCGTNLINYLDLTGLSALTYCNAASADINTIVLNGCTSLTNLSAESNKLSKINLDAAPNLDEVSLSQNQLKTLNLKGVKCRTLDLSNNSLSSVDFSETSGIEQISISNNPLTSINLAGCTSLKNLRAKKTLLTEIDLSGLTALEGVDLYEGNLGRIIFKDNESLTSLELGNNKLSEIDLTGCAGSIEELMLNHNQFTTIHLKDLPNIMLVNLRSNKLTSFSLEGCDYIAGVVLSDNRLTSIDLGTAKEGITNLDIDGNLLTSLDLSGYSYLEELNASRNQLTSVNLTGCDALFRLDLSANRLANLELPLKSLFEVHVYQNDLHGDAMKALIESLPEREVKTEGKSTPRVGLNGNIGPRYAVGAGQLFAVYTRHSKERNLCLKEHVEIAKKRGWGVYDKRTKSDYTGARLCAITTKTEGEGGSILVNGKTELKDVYSDTKVQITAKSEKGFALKTLVTLSGENKEIKKNIFNDRYFYVTEPNTEVVATFTDDICKVTLQRLGEGLLKLEGDGLDLNGLPREMVVKIIAEPFDDNHWDLSFLDLITFNEKGKRQKRKIIGDKEFKLEKDCIVYAEFSPSDPDVEYPTDTLQWDGNKWISLDITTPTVENTIQAKIYPNPATDLVIISDAQPDASVNIYTLSGTLVRTFAINREGYGELSVVDFPEGSYIILVGKEPRKLIIRR